MAAASPIDILLWGLFSVLFARVAINEAAINGWWGSMTTTTNRTSVGVPDQSIFDLPRKVQEPKHLDPIDPSILKHRGYVTLDAAHKMGKIHTGTWIHVVDSAGRVLLLRRGPNLVTCPLAWTVVGEHAYRDEDPTETVRRGITEELGEDVWNVVQEHGRVRNMTALPLYYFRDYGPSNGNRIDRQVTHLWLVELGKPKFDIKLDLDDEVKEHRWMPIDEFEMWVKYDMEGLTAKPKNTEFCHETIGSLLTVGIKRMYDMGITPPGPADGRGIR